MSLWKRIKYTYRIIACKEVILPILCSGGLILVFSFLGLAFTEGEGSLGFLFGILFLSFLALLPILLVGIVLHNLINNIIARKQWIDRNYREDL